jgi:HK97 family phage portal protein
MGIVASVLNRLGWTEKRSSSFAGPALVPAWRGHAVNALVAENLSAVTACVGAISSTMASLPAYVYRQTEAGRMLADDHPVSALLRRPNERQTWPDWLEWMVAQVLLHGNALSVIESDGQGRPTALVPVPWSNVQVFMLPNGRLAYDVVRFIAPWGGNGQPRRLLDDEVFHLRDRSDDGIIGRSRISRAPDVLGQAVGIQTYASAMWANGATPAGVLTVAGSLSTEAAQRLRHSWEQAHTGSHNAKRTVILEQGASWQAMSVSPEDAEVLASRRFTVEELCRLYQVPPPIVQDYTHNTFTNAAQASLWFAQLTLSPWARKIEAEFDRSIFGEDDRCHLDIDLSGLMRGDYSARWAAYAVAVDKRILDVDEIREAEGYNPRGAAPAPEAKVG